MKLDNIIREREMLLTSYGQWSMFLVELGANISLREIYVITVYYNYSYYAGSLGNLVYTMIRHLEIGKLTAKDQLYVKSIHSINDPNNT